MAITSHHHESTSSIVLLFYHHVGRRIIIPRSIRRTSARESAHARAVNHQEQRQRLWIQRLGHTDQADLPRPRATIIRRIGRWHGRTQQRDPEHAHQLQVQRHHQEDQCKETVHRRGAGGQVQQSTPLPLKSRQMTTLSTRRIERAPHGSQRSG